MHPKGIGGAAKPSGALPSANILGMNCLNYENCIENFGKIEVCKVVCFEHTQLFAKFNNLI